MTLDGIDFSKDEVKIADVRAEVEQQKAQALQRGAGGLPTIPEEGKSAAGQSAGAAAAGQNRQGAQRSYQFN